MRHSTAWSAVCAATVLGSAVAHARTAPSTSPGTSAATSPDPAPATAGAARAPTQDPASGEWLFGRRPSAWTVQAEPSIWFPAYGGNIRVGAAGTNAKSERIGSDKPSTTPAGEIHLRDGDLTFTLSGFGFDHDSTAAAQQSFRAGATAVAAGDVASTSISVTGVELTGGYRVWRHDFRNAGADETLPADVSLRLDVYGGGRVYDADTSFRLGAVTEQGSTFLGHPLIGAKAALEIFEKYSVDFAIDYGIWPGSRRASAVNLLVGFQWRPWGNLGVQFGWRGVFLDLKSEALALDGSLQGLYGSIVLRF